MGVPEQLIRMTFAFLGYFLRLGLMTPRRSSAPVAAGIEIINVEGIDDEFNELWESILQNSTRLLACRSAENLRWHFGGEFVVRNIKVLTWRWNGLGVPGVNK